LIGLFQVDIKEAPFVSLKSDLFQVGSSGIEASWAGGANGREVINRVLPLVPELLSNTGIFYMVVIKENSPGNKYHPKDM
jgi:release factor glutamine methyltransferase